MGFGINLTQIPQKVLQSIERELPSRAVRAANALRNGADIVLSGARSGRVYGGHQASAPGEAPAQWSGNLRTKWTPLTDAHMPGIQSEVWYANLLEGGTPGGQMAPRPFRDKILAESWPEVSAIYSESWHISL